MTKFFLVQVSDEGSISIFKNKKYYITDWKKQRKNQDYGKVDVGDLLVIYLTKRSISYQSQIRFIFVVTKITDHANEGRICYLRKYRELNTITIWSIRNMVSLGKLNSVYLNCGRQGFNIIEISEKAVNQLSRTSNIMSL